MAKKNQEDDNSLQSRSSVRLIDVISEGVIEGLVNGDESIYLDETPLQNGNGTYNFEGVRTRGRTGGANQAIIPGFVRVENEVALGVKVEKGTPVVREIADVNASALRIKIRVPALTETDKKTGNIKGQRVDLEFDVKPNGGAFVLTGKMKIHGKTNSPYERQKRIELPESGSPWQVRIRRITPDNEKSNIQNDTFVTSYTILNDAKLNYPNTALVGIEIDAEKFGGQIPARIYEVKGIKSPVPSNYDPATRTYNPAIWDGTFVTAYHNNPAWVLWDLMTHKRYGLGQVFSTVNVDKFGLYAIARYCDELVPSGLGNGVQEPRFRFNGVINSREDAPRVLDAIASCFRGMIYWGSGSVLFTQDAPGTPVKLVTPSNVIDGEFNYAGSSLKARHTSILVTWSDQKDKGRKAIEVVQRDDLIQKYGFRQTELNAYGCTSRGQARRMGEWILDSEYNETEVVSYRCSLDHADVRPGQLISVADPAYAGARYGGRIIAINPANTAITIDAPVALDVGEVSSLSVMMPDGSIQTRNLTNAPGTAVTVLTFVTPLAEKPVEGAMWTISSNQLAPRQFRVVSNKEVADNVYEIVALFHDPTKYARIERNITIETPDYSVFYTGPLQPPIDLSVKEFKKLIGNTSSDAVTLSWSPPTNDPRVQSYEVQTKDGNDPDYRISFETSAVSSDVYPIVEGVFRFRVRSKAFLSTSSEWVYYEFYAFASNVQLQDVTGFTIATAGSVSTLAWDQVISTNLSHYEIRWFPAIEGATWETSQIVISTVTATAVTATVNSRYGSYLIKAVNFIGGQSVNAAIVTSQIAIAQIENVVAVINEIPLLGQFGTNDLYDVFWTAFQSSITGPQPAFDGEILIKETATNNAHMIENSIAGEPLKKYFFSGEFRDNGRRYINIIMVGNGVNNYANAYVDLQNKIFISGGSFGEFSNYRAIVDSSPFNDIVKVKIYFTTGVNTVNISRQIRLNNGISDSYTGSNTNSGVFAKNLRFEDALQGTFNDNERLRLANADTTLMIDWVPLASLDKMADTFLQYGVYYFKNSFDFGYTAQAACRSLVNFTVLHDEPTIINWQPLSTATPMGGDFGGVTVTVQFSTMVDGNDWTEWKVLDEATYVFQIIRFRVVLTSIYPYSSPLIDTIQITIDMEDRIENAADVLCPAGGLTVNFTTPFRVIPSIAIDGQGLLTGDYSRITSKTRGSFRIEFFNSANVSKAATFDWIAKGYGF